MNQSDIERSHIRHVVDFEREVAALREKFKALPGTVLAYLGDAETEAHAYRERIEALQ